MLCCHGLSPDFTSRHPRVGPGQIEVRLEPFPAPLFFLAPLHITHLPPRQSGIGGLCLGPLRCTAEACALPLPPSTGMSSMPAPWRGPREIQLWFQSSELVDWADGHLSSIYAAEHAGACSHPGIHTQDQLPHRKNLSSHPCSAHLSQTTSLSSFCPTPAPEWVEPQTLCAFY